MRILLVTQYYWPEDFAAGVYMPELAEGLRSRGHEVEVLTGFPNYPEGKIRAPYRGRLFCKEDRRGVRIIRSWFHPSPRSSGAMRRGASAATFGISALLARSALQRADIVLGFSPPLFMGMAALACARRWRVPLLLNVKDLFTEAIIASGLARPGPLTRMLQKLERGLYRAAAGVVVPVRDFVPPLIASGVDPGAIRVIPDWADGDEIRPAASENAIRKEWGCEGAFVVLYSGSMGYSSMLETVLRAAKELADLSELRVVLVGEGVKRPALEKLAAELKLTSVHFHPLQSRQRLPQVLAAADVALVTLSRSGGRVSTQGKLYSLLAAGRPVVAVAPRDNEAVRVVEEGRCGWWASPEDPSGLARLLRRLVRDPREVEEMGRAARSVFEAEYSLPAAVQQFERALASVQGASARSSAAVFS